MKHRTKAVAVALVGTVVGLLPVAPAAAAPTCSVQMGIAVHGEHVVSDYVVGEHGTWPPAGTGIGAALKGRGAALPGGPGAHGHLPAEIAPGASFCVTQSQAPGFHF